MNIINFLACNTRDTRDTLDAHGNHLYLYLHLHLHLIIHQPRQAISNSKSEDRTSNLEDDGDRSELTLRHFTKETEEGVEEGEVSRASNASVAAYLQLHDAYGAQHTQRNVHIEGGRLVEIRSTRFKYSRAMHIPRHTVPRTCHQSE